MGVFDSVDRPKRIDDLHRDWFGDISKLRVLELGVGHGSSFSRDFARNAAHYTAIDLSAVRIDALREKLGSDGENADLRAADFLSEELTGEFDLIYALAVFHHFKHIDAFLDHVLRRLAPGGRVVTYDPVAVWLPARLLRAAYRPLQTDAAWEWPFTEESMSVIESRFRVLACQGFMGRSKWASAVGILSPAVGRDLARRWFDADMAEMTTPASLRHCLQVSYHLQKP